MLQPAKLLHAGAIPALYSNFAGEAFKVMQLPCKHQNRVQVLTPAPKV
jgi:hypothetical protein